MKKQNLSSVRHFVRAVRGANMVEYIILVGLVALIGMGVFTTFGKKSADIVTKQGTTVEGINTKGN